MSSPADAAIPTGAAHPDGSPPARKPVPGTALHEFDALVGNWVRDARARTQDFASAGAAADALRHLESALDELEVSSEELRIQKEELNALLQDADHERQRFLELFQDAPDAYIVTDGFGVIRQLNDRASALIGVPGSRATGKPLSLYISEDCRESFRNRLSSSATENIVDWRCDVVSRSGAQIPVRVRTARDARPAQLGKAEIRWILEDLRPHLEKEKQASALQFEHARRLAAEAAEQRALFLAEASRRLSGVHDASGLAGIIVSSVVPAVGDYCVLDLLHDGEIRNAGIEITAELKQHHIQPLQTAHPGAKAMKSVVSTGEAEVLSAREVGGEPACSEVIVPLRLAGRVLGSLRVGSCNTARNLATDLHFMQAYADRAAAALETAALMAELVEARCCADEANRTKTEFLATVSHELRTPLTAVLGYSELLLTGIPESLTPKAHDFVERIQESARHQRDLVEQILLCARLDAGAEAAFTTQADLRLICEHAVQMLEPDAQRRGIALSADLADHAIEAITDEGKVRQIVLNLLANGIRFTEHGSVHLALRATDDQAEIEVTDTGIGIPTEAQDRIFKRFVQLDQSDSRRYGGTGLGLTIVRDLVTLLGGTISVRSTVRQGSTFTVRVPRKSNSPASVRTT